MGWGAGLLVAFATLACRSVDESVLDARLRAASVDAYLGFLDEEFGGFDAAGVTLESLRDRHRAEAIDAARPEDFYAVLRAMVAELQDPHAGLVVSERFWPGPISIPERVSTTHWGGGVWLTLPRQSIRDPEEMAAALDGWLDGIREGLGAGDPGAIACLLARSAAPPEGLHPPMAWLELQSVSGQPVTSTHGALLLLEGPLGSTVEITGLLDGAEVTLGLLRNAGRIREPGSGEFGEGLGPSQLARLLDPEVPLPPRRWRVRPLEVEQHHIQELLAGSARVAGVDREVAREYGLEGRVLISPGGRPVAYLRIGDFEREAWPDDVVTDERDAKLLESLRVVMKSLGTFDDWIVDLTWNHGGRWLDLGSAVSFFLPEEEEFVPHEVRGWRQGTTWGFLPTLERVSVRQRRVDVPVVRPKRLLVLVDQGTGSSAEILASTLRAMAGARLIGERTVGAELAVTEFEAPDGSRFRVGGVGGMTSPCEPFQARGLEPDVPILLPPPDQAGLGPAERQQRFRYEALRSALLLMDQLEP